MDIGPLKPAAPQAEGLVDMVFDASRCLDQPLTAERLFTWQASLFPDGRNGSRNFRLGAWRDGGAGETAPFTPAEGFPHYKPPPAARLPGEMKNYLDWFNSGPVLDPVLKAALAHLGFVTIHPFDAGNGLIARAITDLVLARCESSTHRFYSLSAQIALERNDYFSMLEQTLQGTMDITPWLEWFLGCLGRAIDGAQITLKAVIGKAKFWQDNAALAINDRQRKVLNFLLDYVKPKFTTLQYAKFAKCSHDTALRDILSLVERGIFVRNSKGGRSTDYSLGPLC
jgi:Fic family protein